LRWGPASRSPSPRRTCPRSPFAGHRVRRLRRGRFDVGFDGRAGLAIQLSRSFALFGEYRYTYVEPHFEDEIDVASAPFSFETDVDIEPDLATHHVVFGGLLPLLIRPPTGR
jgi:hypothetical protein